MGSNVGGGCGRMKDEEWRVVRVSFKTDEGFGGDGKGFYTDQRRQPLIVDPGRR
jgi:hypothetical protein